MQSTSAYLPLWGAGELAALSQDYRKSTIPNFSDIVPENVKLIAYMQDTHWQLDNLATVYKRYDETYKNVDRNTIVRQIAEKGVDREVIKSIFDSSKE